MDEKGNDPIMVVQPAESQTVVVIQQPIAGGAPVQLREWTTGVFDCCSDCGTCLFGCFCLNCLVCSISSRLGEHCLAGHCGGIVALRTKLRVVNGIEGGVCSDGCYSVLCTPCVACQMDREIKHLGR